MARYPQGILVACPSPWDDRDELDEATSRRGGPLVLAAGFEHFYVFGTGGEGYAVDTRRFRQVVDVVPRGGRRPRRSARWSASSACRRSRSSSASSTPTTSGFRMFQISLPSRGAPLDDDEVLRFFSDVCGAFPDSRFLHYNLPRTKRVLGGRGLRQDHPGRPQPRRDQDDRRRDGRVPRS